MKRRRVLVALAAGALGAALASHAQPQSSKIFRIGFLGIAFASGYVREVEWIREGLRKLGYVEGRNLAIEFRWAEGSPDKLREFARELVALKVDLILTHALGGALTAARETSTIPIVMADGADPVAAGIAASLARPGGNVTGSTSFVVEEAAKRLQLLKEVVPRAKRVAFLLTEASLAVTGGRAREALHAAAGSMKVDLVDVYVKDAPDFPDAFNAMGKSRIEAVVVSNEPLLNSHAGAIAGLTAVKRLPSIGYASYADAGGMLAYGANRPALYGRAAYFIDRIFKGAKPGDIPIERAAKFDLIVNRRTAKSLGVVVPQSLLLRADRVIE